MAQNSVNGEELIEQFVTSVSTDVTEYELETRILARAKQVGELFADAIKNGMPTDGQPTVVHLTTKTGPGQLANSVFHNGKTHRQIMTTTLKVHWKYYET